MNREINFPGQPVPQPPAGDIIKEKYTGGPVRPMTFQSPAPAGSPPGAHSLEIHVGLTILDTYALEILKAIMDKGVRRTRKGPIFPESQGAVNYAFDVALRCTAKRRLIIEAAKGNVSLQPEKPETALKDESAPAAQENHEEPQADA